MGDDYTIADIAMLGWVRNLIGFYGAARARRLRAVQARRRLAGARPGAAGGAARDWRSRSGRERRSLGHAGRLQRLGVHNNSSGNGMRARKPETVNSGSIFNSSRAASAARSHSPTLTSATVSTRSATAKRGFCTSAFSAQAMASG